MFTVPRHGFTLRWMDGGDLRLVAVDYLHLRHFPLSIVRLPDQDRRYTRISTRLQCDVHDRLPCKGHPHGHCLRRRHDQPDLALAAGCLRLAGVVFLHQQMKSFRTGEALSVNGQHLGWFEKSRSRNPYLSR